MVSINKPFVWNQIASCWIGTTHITGRELEHSLPEHSDWAPGWSWVLCLGEFPWGGGERSPPSRWMEHRTWSRNYGFLLHCVPCDLGDVIPSEASSVNVQYIFVQSRTLIQGYHLSNTYCESHRKLGSLPIWFNFISTTWKSSYYEDWGRSLPNIIKLITRKSQTQDVVWTPKLVLFLCTRLPLWAF